MPESRVQKAIMRGPVPESRRHRFRGLAVALLGLLLPWLAWAQDSAPPYLVGFAQDDLSNDWRAAQVQALERAFAEDPDIRFIHTDARGSTARQIQHIEELAARGVDVLLTSPRDTRAMTPVIQEVYRNGTPVVLLTRRIKTDDYTVFIHPDDCDIGRKAARFLAERLEGRGRILVLEGVPRATTTLERTRCFRRELAGFDELRIVASPSADYLRGPAILAVEGVIESGTRFDAIFAESDSMAAGARLALEHAGIDPRSMPIVGVDYITEARRALLDGSQAATFTYPTCADEGARATRAILRGKPVPKEIIVPTEMVTPENAATVAPIF